MAHTRTTLPMALFLAGASAHVVAAQHVQPAVFGTVAAAHLYRAEDQSFGTVLNAGAGAGIEWKRLGLDAEIHRTAGLTPRTVGCSVTAAPCVGSAREGFLRATLLSANVSYFFNTRRVRPYATASIGVLWTTGVNSVTIVHGAGATVSEFQERNAGLAVGGGVGVDVRLTPAISLRPEFRTYSSVARSRVNVGMHRGSLGVRYRW